MSAAEIPRTSVVPGALASLVIHVSLIAAFFLIKQPPTPPLPRVYRVQLFAAPPGEVATGVVNPTPAPVTPPVAPAAQPVKHQQVVPVPSPTGRRAPVKQVTETPVTSKPSKNAVPTAKAGSASGGSGADVTNLETPGFEFPYPAYLKNIVNQIIARFRPRVRTAGLSARVRFMIRRDGTVPIESIQLDQSSGVFTFNQDALAAVEEAAHNRAFGPLPAGFAEDVLPVFFRFDPSVIR